MANYICAFRGRRDSYQLPLALAEAGLLDQLITDAYASPWLRRAARYTPVSIREKIDFRSEPGIPIEQVRCLWLTTALEQARHTVGLSPMVTYRTLDRNFSLAAARRAALSHGDLLLYNSYAWEAFTARYSHQPRRVLFQYHPHPSVEERILTADRVRYPNIGESYAGAKSADLAEDLLKRERDCWKHADLILCASSFTKQSLIEAGADEGKCGVVPYGIEVPRAPEAHAPEFFQAVFVGSGTQRKGLHHLLLAWQRASLPAGSKLIVVCRVLDRGIEELAARTAQVEVRRGVTQSELTEFFASSTLFVMPSLVEGFGQVYLEALAQGCPVLGTANTCLPDLGREADGVFLTSPGNIDELVDKLERLSKVLVGNRQLRNASRACANRFPWNQFRSVLRERLAH